MITETYRQEYPCEIQPVHLLYAVACYRPRRKEDNNADSIKSQGHLLLMIPQSCAILTFFVGGGGRRQPLK